MDYKAIREKYNLDRLQMQRLIGLGDTAISNYELGRQMAGKLTNSIYTILDGLSAEQAKALKVGLLLTKKEPVDVLKIVLKAACK